MPLIICKAELKPKYAKYCSLSTAGADNFDANSNNVIFTKKETKLYIPVVTLSVRDKQKLWNVFSKGLERSVYWNAYNTKSDNENTKNECRYFLESNFVGVNRLFTLIYLNRDNDVKQFKSRRNCLPKGITKSIEFHHQWEKFLWPSNWFRYKTIWKN